MPKLPVFRLSVSQHLSFSPSVTLTVSQTFLRELDRGVASCCERRYQREVPRCRIFTDGCKSALRVLIDLNATIPFRLANRNLLRQYATTRNSNSIVSVFVKMVSKHWQGCGYDPAIDCDGFFVRGSRPSVVRLPYRGCASARGVAKTQRIIKGRNDLWWLVRKVISHRPMARNLTILGNTHNFRPDK